MVVDWGAPQSNRQNAICAKLPFEVRFKSSNARDVAGTFFALGMDKRRGMGHAPGNGSIGLSLPAASG
jgi:hypothetical protein